MIQLRLVGLPNDVDTVLHALSEVVEVLAGRRKPSRDGDGRVLQYGTIAVLNPPAEPMYGLGDLARALGGAETSFTGRVLELVAKAQATPANLQRLALAFPREVRAYSIWMACDPTPTAEVLLALLDRAVLLALLDNDAAALARLGAVHRAVDGDIEEATHPDAQP
jgi:hypothetical protein